MDFTTQQILDARNNGSLKQNNSTVKLVDPKNNPSLVKIDGIPLPYDVIILLDGEKIIAESKILDGVSLFERVSRKPFNVNFEFTIRENNITGIYSFPQETLENYMNYIWNADQVVTVINTYLNGIGIDQLIIKGITIAPIRGNTNVSGSIKCLENYHDNKGGTLVIPL